VIQATRMSEVVPCHKRCYPSYQAAMSRLVAIAFETGWRVGTKPCSAYYHRPCRSWHLTRQAR
jgi:hypothetical protein